MMNVTNTATKAVGLFMQVTQRRVGYYYSVAKNRLSEHGSGIFATIESSVVNPSRANCKEGEIKRVP